jgi:hypothetical protein
MDLFLMDIRKLKLEKNKDKTTEGTEFTEELVVLMLKSALIAKRIKYLKRLKKNLQSPCPLCPPWLNKKKIRINL